MHVTVHLGSDILEEHFTQLYLTTDSLVFRGHAQKLQLPTELRRRLRWIHQ